MPQKKSAVSLDALCLSSIVRDMDAYWCDHYVNHFMDPTNENHIIAKYIVGPFEYLPQKLAHKIIVSLSQTKRLKRAHLHLLIDNHLTSLDLNASPHALTVCNRDIIGKLIQIRCKKMVKLSLGHLNKISKATLLELTSRLTRLTSLNLQSTLVNDAVVQTIGSYLTNLVDLNISGCRVADAGAMALNPTKVGSCCSGCPFMVHLNLDMTQVTVSCLVLLLTNMTELDYLKHDLIAQAIAIITSERTKESVEMFNKLKLNYFYYDHHSSVNDNSYKGTLSELLYYSAITCQNLTHIDITCLNSTSLNSIAEMKHVYSVTLCGFNFRDLKYLLQECGTRLTYLYLGNTCELDLSFVERYCCNLEELHLDIAPDNSCRFYAEDVHNDAVTSLHCLRHLSVTGLYYETVDDIEPLQFEYASYWLLKLLSAPKLESIHLHHVSTLTDHVLQQLVMLDCLNMVTECVCTDCNGVSGTTFIELIESSSNHLHQLRLIDCFRINRSDYTKMLDLIKTYNYDVSVEYS